MSVALDVNTDGGSFSNVTSVSFSHAGGSPDYLLVRVSCLDGSALTISATYDSASMTSVSTFQFTTQEGTDKSYSAIFEKKSPSSGTKTVAITLSSGSYGACGSQSYTGVDQTTSTGTPVTASNTTGTTHTHTVSSTTGNLVADSIFIYNALGTSDMVPNQTLRFRGLGYIALYYGGAAQDADGTGSVDMTWTWTPNGGYGHIAVEIKAAAAGAGFPFQQNLMQHILVR